MDQGSNSNASNSEYRQPFAIALLAAIFGFVYVYYRHGDALRSLMIASIEFLLLFWVVLRGNNFIKRRKSVAEHPKSAKTSKSNYKLRPILLSLVFCAIGVGISVAIYNTARETSKRQAKAEEQWRKNEDDKVSRERKVELIFWTDLTSTPHPSFEERFQNAIPALGIPVRSIEKNFPTGPIVVIYEGTAKNASEIQSAVRAVGVPTHTYQLKNP